MGPKKKWHHQQQLKRTTEQQQATDSTTAAGDIAGQEHEKRPKKRRVSSISLGQVKGHQAVVGTCDVRNDRAATAELVDLLNTVADDMYPEEEGGTGQDPPATASGVDEEQPTATPAAAAASSPAPASLSVEEMVRQEADGLRSGKDKSHRFKSVNTFVKGVIMVCVMDPRIDIVRLVDAVFAEIRTTRKRRSRLLERVTPMQVTSFSEIETFTIAAQPVVIAALPQVAEGVPPLAPVAAAPKKAVGAATAATEEVAAMPASHGGGEEAAAAAAATAAATATPVEDSISAKETARSGSVGIAGKGEGGAAAEDAAVTGDGGPGGVDTGDAKEEAPKATEVSNGGTAPKADVRKEEQAGAAVGAAAAGDAGVVIEDSGDSGKTCDRRWKFRVDIRRRNSGLKRLDLINAVAGSVGKGHSVSMASPDVTIAVEAVKSVVGASVLFDYALNHEYSISRLQDAVCDAILDS